jgi:hypothetical protein
MRHRALLTRMVRWSLAGTGVAILGPHSPAGRQAGYLWRFGLGCQPT